MKYRYLKQGEMLREGDEYFSEIFRDWMETSFAGQIVKMPHKIPYRRKMKDTSHPHTNIFK